MQPRACPIVLFAAAMALACAPALAQVHVLTAPADGTLPGRFGHWISLVPDVDGDGVIDLLVANLGSGSVHTPRWGAAHLYSGASLQHLLTVRPPMDGDPQNKDFASTVSGVPDVDGDGRGDILVGAHADSSDGAPTFAGRAFVYSGATGELIHTINSPSPSFASNFAIFVRGMPDVDGDGMGDLVVTQDGLGLRRIYVFSGATAQLIHTLPPAMESSSYLTADWIPDLDGDGFADIVAGSPLDRTADELTRRGRAYIYSGLTGALVHTLQSPNLPSMGFGNFVGGLTDVSGDGFGDVVVGSWEANPGQPIRSGSVHVFDGASGALLRSISSPTAVQSGQAYFVAPLIDVDGDGRPDLAVGAANEAPLGASWVPPGGDPSMAQTGAVHLFSGATGGHLHFLMAPNYQFGTRFAGMTVAIAGPFPHRRATVFVGFGDRSEVYGYAICKADANTDGVINSRDISHFITGWLATRGLPPGELGPPGLIHGDHDGDGAVSTADIAAFITHWLAAIQAGGCP